MRLRHLHSLLRNDTRSLIVVRNLNCSGRFYTSYPQHQITMASPAQTYSNPPTNNSVASLSSTPAANQLVHHGSKTFTTVREGLAYILIPPDAPRELDPKSHGPSEPAQSVFYNPIQQYNRDLTVLAIRVFGEDFLARGALKKAKKNQRNGNKGKKRDASEVGKELGSNGNVPGVNTDSSVSVAETKGAEGITAEEVSNQSSAGANAADAANSRKRKLNDDEATETETKKAKIASDLGEFEDSKITDEDLLAIESSVGIDPPFSTAKEATSESSNTIQASEVRPATAKTRPIQSEDLRPQFRILDALSATGLRALRYAHELPFVTQVRANDLSKAAVETIKLNIAHNKLGDTVKTSTGNANAHMYNFVGQEGTGGPGHKYQVIDLDPYGTAVPFLDAAVQALADGGLLCVTCTDTGVFNSMGYAEKAFSLYGGLPGKGDHCHEIGLRLILHCIATTAAKYGISMEPLLSLSIDYYARVFVRLRKSPKDVKFHGSKTMLAYACDHGCGAWKTQFLMRTQEQENKKGLIWHKYTVAQGPSSDKLCECCGSKMHVAGPMYGGPLHNPSFIGRVLELLPSLDKETYKTLPRVEGMLSLAQEEMSIHNMAKLTVPFEVPKGVSSDQANKEKMTTKRSTNEDMQKPTNTEAIPDEGELGKETNDAHHEALENPLKKIFESVSPVAQDHHPFYIIPSSLSRVVRCPSPPYAAFRGALRGLGYQAVRSHAHAGTIKTDAPWEAIWDIMAAWVRQLPTRNESLKEGMAGYHVLKRAEEREKARNASIVEATANGGATPPHGDSSGETSPSKEVQNGADAGAQNRKTWKIVFDEKLGQEEPKNKRLIRYQINPRANWGPMARAK